MRSYATNILINLRLTFRDRMAIVFSYMFPLVFFFLFGQTMGARQGSGISRQVVASVLLIGVLGNGFFGGGMRAVAEREQGILRRFKVAPTTALPLLVASLVVGLVTYLPSALLLLGLGSQVYGMPAPERPMALVVFLSVGLLAFRAVGLIVASVVNSMQESQILIQMLYLPMLLLSGGTLPVSMLPRWLQIVSQFLPSSHLFSGLQGILIRGESLGEQSKALAALGLTVVVATFVARQLFRWEKEEKVRPAAKLWLAGVLAPFVVLGMWEWRTDESLTRQRVVMRDLQRSRSMLLHGARLVIGDGQVVEEGSVLVRDGKIARVFVGPVDDVKSMRAEVIEAAGKTVLPGLIDLDARLTSRQTAAREMAQELYCGVTAVRTAPDAVSAWWAAKARGGEEMTPEIFERGAPGAGASRLALAEASEAIAGGRLTPALGWTLTQQAALPAWRAAARGLNRGAVGSRETLAAALERVRERHGAGGSVAVATGAAGPGLPAGPAMHRELALLVAAGLTPAEALTAATGGAATALGAGERIGFLRPGYEASLLVVDGNPAAQIGDSERIAMVVLRGERLGRAALLKSGDEEE